MICLKLECISSLITADRSAKCYITAGFQAPEHHPCGIQNNAASCKKLEAEHSLLCLSKDTAFMQYYINSV
jgi:hypothetical protein